MYKSKRQKEKRQAISKKMNAGREKKRLESYPPEYPPVLPELRREIIIIDYDHGMKVYHMHCYKTNRIDCYKTVVNGKIWREMIGWSNILSGIRKSLPRLMSERNL